MKRAVIVAGLGFGDESKASIVDAVAREIGATLVVRYSGGAQRAGRVVLDDGRAHIFSQFGSGTLVGAATFLSRFMLIEPFAFEHEASALEALGLINPLSTVTIDGEAPIITPYHRAANRLREFSRGDGRHGSCGMGIGELAYDLIHYPGEVIRAKDLWSSSVIREKLHAVKMRKLQVVNRLNLPSHLAVDTELDLFRAEDAYDRDRASRWLARYEAFYRKVKILLTDRHAVNFMLHDNIVFEGAQGVLLDESYGFHPHTTWSNCTLDNAYDLLIHGHGLKDRQVTTLGVTRTYATRHGAGPFPTEAVLPGVTPDPHNVNHPFQGGFRTGHLDAVMLRYALSACANKFDGLAVTHVDALAKMETVGLAIRYGRDCTSLMPTRQSGGMMTAALEMAIPHYRAFIGEGRSERFLQAIEAETGLPILVTSVGPTAAGKRWAPNWMTSTPKMEAASS